MRHWVDVLASITVPRILPTHIKAGFRLLRTNCQVWVGIERTNPYSGGLHKLEEL